MICSFCYGDVQWQGKLTELTHTKCVDCGAINSQFIDTIPDNCADCACEEQMQPCEACDNKKGQGLQRMC